MGRMKALSVKQPWAYLLCAGLKGIENRTWKLPEKYKGETILIHASARRLSFVHTYNHLWKLNNSHPTGGMREIMHKEGLNPDLFNSLPVSAIIGSVRFVDCVINHPSIWAEQSSLDGFIRLGDEKYASKLKRVEKPIYNWVVEDAVLFKRPILNVKGKLSFWGYKHPYYCPDCGYPLHLQYSGGGVTDAFCFQCGKDIEITKMIK